MKETYYFQHDYNATQDPKMMTILSKCGLSGLAIYWIIIEILHQQPESKITLEEYRGFIQFYGKIDNQNEQVLNKIEQELINVKLFIEQDNYIYSERVLENKKERERLSEKRSMAGKKSAEIRANLTSVEQVLNKGQQGKEKKGKERKRNIVSVGRFAPPTLNEIKIYCEERKNGVDYQKFFDFYEAKGWMVGKNKMKEWRAAVRTWERTPDKISKEIEIKKDDDRKKYEEEFFKEHGYYPLR